MIDRWKLTNKKALVTGGTKGIGKAIVKEFVALGAEVLIVARNKADFTALQNELNTEKISFMEADLSKKQDLKLLVQTTTKKWGSLDILVNNVGTNIRKKQLNIRKMNTIIF